MNLQVLLSVLSLSSVSVRANFELMVNFISYTNPTGLCAECETRLEDVTSADQLTPVCCDESPFRSDNCDNTGEARCDTRFRWTIRPFGVSLETRPASKPNAADPPYYFTDCNLPGATCPFSKMSTTFSQGPTGFLGVAANPLPVVNPPTLTSWTGRVQFFIEAVDSGLPFIIDSLLINLDNLQFGADFTEEMTFTGYHNISHMTMSFRVACQTGFCGTHCTITPQNNPKVSNCYSNGSLTCTNKRFDPSSGCTQCLPNRDPSTNCSTCLPGWDRDYDCSVCLPRRNITTNCTTYNNSGKDCTLIAPKTSYSASKTSNSDGIYGGVIGVLLMVILILTIALACTCKKERKKNIYMKRNLGYGVTDISTNNEHDYYEYVSDTGGETM